MHEILVFNFYFPGNLICEENFMIIDVMKCKEQKWVIEDGNKVWHNAKGQLHRVDGPAREFASGTKMWYLNGECHRENGPAVEYADGTKYWYIEGKELTEEEFNNRSTCTIDSDGTKRWKNKQGQLHRIDGPAVEWFDGDKYWYLNDKLHREDGPAIERASGAKYWYIEGEELTREEFNNRPTDAAAVEDSMS